MDRTTLLKQPRVLIVDDEHTVCELLNTDLCEEGYSCNMAFSGKSALAMLTREDFDVVLLDIALPEISGIDLLREISSNYPDTVTIMITALSDIDTAIESMKSGASDYITKPFRLDRVNSSISLALQKKSNLAENNDNYEPLHASREKEDFGEIRAIASGVSTMIDLQDNRLNRSNIVTGITVKTARELGIDEEQIQRWVKRREIKERRNLAVVRKYEKSVLAQVIMGNTEIYNFEDSLFDYEN